MLSQSRIKFLFITNNPFPRGMALTNRILSLALGLVKNGHTVSVLCIRPTETNAKNFSINPRKGAYEGIQYSYSYKNVRSKSFLKRRIDDFLGLLFTFVYLAKQLFKKKPVIVFFGNSFLFEILMCLFAKTFGIRAVKEESEIPTIYFRTKAFSLHRFNLYVHLVPRMYELNALMTENLMAFFLKKKVPPKKLICLPNAIDMGLFLKRNSSFITKNLPTDYIAFSGSLNNEKDGILGLIEVFDVVAKQFSEISLVVMGAGSEEDLVKLKGKIEICGLKERVLFLGRLDSSYVPYILCNAKVLVSLRPQSEQAFYGFPTKILEYLLSGRPVVTTITGELYKYLIDKENCFITTGLEDDIITTLYFVLSNSTLANRIGKNGQKLVLQKFKAEAVAHSFATQLTQ